MDVAATPAEVISGVIYESDECPDIFEKEALELAGGIIEALAEAGFDIKLEERAGAEDARLETPAEDGA